MMYTKRIEKAMAPGFGFIVFFNFGAARCEA
jgi:hypothetical protein